MLTRAEALKEFAGWSAGLLVGKHHHKHHRRRKLMGTFYVPYSAGLPPNFQQAPAAVAGQALTGMFYVIPPGFSFGNPVPLAIAPTSDGPTIMQQWRVVNISIPGCIIATPQSTQLSVCALAITAYRSGEPVWSASQSVPILGSSGEPAGFVIVDDLVNPFTLNAGQNLTFGFSMSFDQAVVLGSVVQLASNATFPTQPQPGPIRYEVVYDRRLPGRS